MNVCQVCGGALKTCTCKHVLEAVPLWGAALTKAIATLDVLVATLEQDLPQAEIRALDAQERVARLEQTQKSHEKRWLIVEKWAEGAAEDERRAEPEPDPMEDD